MTVPNSADVKGIDLDIIVKTLQNAGFEVEGYKSQSNLFDD